MKTYFLISRATGKGLLLLAVLAALESCSGNNSPDVSGTSKKKQEAEKQQSYASRQSIPTPKPYVTPAPVAKIQSTSPTPVPTPTPTTSIPPKPAPEAGNMELNAIIFRNMEHKEHAAEVGSYAILEVAGKLAAYGPLLLSSASNGSTVSNAGGAYPVTKLKIGLDYRNSDIPNQGQGQLSICKINGAPSPSLNSSQCLRRQANGWMRGR